MTDIRRLIQEGVETAKTKGGGEIKIPKGTYFFDKTIEIADVSDLTIDGGCSTFIFNDSMNGGIGLIRCKNVTLMNFIVDYDPVPFTQGEIVAIDPDGKYYDLKIDEGYRRDEAFIRKDMGGDLCFHFFDPITRNPNRTADTISPRHMEFKDDIIRIEPTNLNFAWNNIQLGDLAATSHSWTAVAVRLLHCAHVKVKNVTLYSSAGAGMIERYGYGGAELSFRIERGELPKGATKGRLFTVPRDGFHTTGTVKGAYVHDTYVEHNGDDGLNFWAHFYKVTAVDRGSGDVSLFTVLGDTGPNPMFLLEGDPVIVYDGKTAVEKGRTTVTWAKGLDAKLKHAADIEEGDFLICPDRVAHGARIENNTFMHIDGIGLLLKSPGAIVRNNHIQGMGHAGMWVGCYLGLVEGGYLEGPFPEDLTIENNTIIDTGFVRLCRSDWFQASGGIHIGHVSELKDIQKFNREVKNITIRNNLIKSAATYGILVSNAKNVRIEGNILSDTNNADPFYVPEKLSINKQGAIVIKASDDVVLKGNSFSHPGVYNEADVYQSE